MINTSLNKHLRNRRKELGLKQKDVAKQLELSSPQFISNFERNICNVPFPMLSQIMNLYKLESSTIVELILRDHKDYILKNLGNSESLSSIEESSQNQLPSSKFKLSQISANY